MPLCQIQTCHASTMEYCRPRVQHDGVWGRVKGRIWNCGAAFLWVKTKLSRTLQGWKTDGRGGYSGCLLNCVPGRGRLQNECSQALSVQESEDVGWNYEMADAETQEYDPLEKVSLCPTISCHYIWLLEASIYSKGNWVDLWNKHQEGDTKCIRIQPAGFWAAVCGRPEDCLGKEGSPCA